MWLVYVIVVLAVALVWERFGVEVVLWWRGGSR